MKPFDAIFNPLPFGHDLLWRVRALAGMRGRGLFKGRPPRERVVLFHVGRSGSTVLGSQLKQHSRVFWDSEIYEELFQAIEARGRSLEEAVRGVDPAAYLAKRLAWSGPFLYGFEVNFFHLRLFGTPLSRYIDLLQDLGFRHFILLERKNALRELVRDLDRVQEALHGTPFAWMAEEPV